MNFYRYFRKIKTKSGKVIHYVVAMTIDGRKFIAYGDNWHEAAQRLKNDAERIVV